MIKNEDKCEAVIIPQKTVDRLKKLNIYTIPYGTNGMLIAFKSDAGFVLKTDIKQIKDSDSFVDKCYINSCNNHPVEKRTLYDEFTEIGTFEILNIPENIQEATKDVIVIMSDSEGGTERVCDEVCQTYTNKYKNDIVVVPEYEATILVSAKLLEENKGLLSLIRRHAEADACRNNLPLLCTMPVVYPYEEPKES